mgnify:CR=1 FL=1
MKKLVSFLLALVLTLSLTTEALAAVVSPKADATEITADQTVKLTVTASEEEKLTGVVCLNYRVYFDPAFFELDAEASAADFEGAKLTALKTDDRGSYYAVSLLDTTSAGLAVSGDLYTLAFKVKDGAKVGDTSKLTLVKAYVYAIEDGAMKPMDDGVVDNGEVTVKIVAPIPADVKLGTAKADSDGITVTWAAAEHAVAYKVLRKTADSEWTVLAEQITATSYKDKTAKAGVKYIYTVQGVNADGKLSVGYDTTGVSATIPAAPTPTTPANVTLGSAKVSGSTIVVTWQAANGAAQYRVYRKDAANPKWKGIANVTGTSWTDKTAVAGVKYTYTVRGISANGTLSPGFDTTGVSATIPAAPTPTTPDNVTLGSAKVNGSTIVVTWQAANGAAEYRVYRKDAANPKWKGIANVTGTSWTDKTAQAGVKYTYTVRGISANGTLSPGYDTTGVSATIPGTPTPTTPANVTLGSAKVSGSTIVVTWQAANGAAQYRVYRKDAANPKWKGIANVTGTSWTDKTAQAGVKYTYTVRGISANGTLSPGFDTTGVSATIPAAPTPTPTTPDNVTLGSAKVSGSTIVVTWQAANGAAEYRVYRKDAVNTKWKGIANVTGTSWTDKTAQAGVKYTYTVRGISANGTLSPGFDTTGVSATVPGAPTPAPTTPAEVTLIGAVAGSDGITVKWKAAAGAKEYRVYRKGPGETKWKGLVNVTGISWTDRGVKAGAKYTYTVRGIGADGKTLSPTYNNLGVSTTATVTPVPITPANVTLIGATAGSSGIQVTWKTAAGAEKYRVYRIGPGDAKWVGLVNVTGTGWTDTNVKAGVKYTYTVRGISVDGKLSPGFDKTGVSAVAK